MLGYKLTQEPTNAEREREKKLLDWISFALTQIHKNTPTLPIVVIIVIVVIVVYRCCPWRNTHTHTHSDGE